MREEERDWAVYCLISGGRATTRESIVGILDLDPDTIEESLQRLEASLLIGREGAELRALSIGESIVRCQARYNDDFPVYVENGVIKVRQKRMP
ncbi:MAG: MarR family transcriptional regulator [Methanomicrobiales archaeon]|nr:MarR family transcriptional regulator [Methanomicrobiales archaeon]MDI6877206.1 MarR family transcriptional regulator [Methanomicrobiales archaeon]